MTLQNQTVEHVLVVPSLLFREIGYFQGFQPNSEPYLRTLLDPSYTSWLPRDEVEEDPSYKQLIPYCIFRCGGRVFHYARGSEQGESRLHAKRSVGVGGHISREDGEGAAGAAGVYQEGMWREIQEEVYLETEFTERCVGLINDDQSDVGRVHLGIVHVFDLEAPKVRPREQSMIQTGFSQPAELLHDLDAFETWSQICLKNLFA